MRLIIFGSPGSGKGTQSAFIKQRYGISHLSTGDILRGMMEQPDQPLGDKVREVMNSGGLVDDALMYSVVKARLSLPDCNRGFVLDGYPRTIEQVAALDQVLEQMRWSVDAVLVLALSPQVIIERLEKRADSSQSRVDDSPDVVKHRIELYREKAGPVISSYRERGLIKNINADGSPQEVLQQIATVLDPMRELSLSQRKVVNASRRAATAEIEAEQKITESNEPKKKKKSSKKKKLKKKLKKTNSESVSSEENTSIQRDVEKSDES